SAPPRRERAADALRPIAVRTGWNAHAEGSASVTWGRTEVLATVTVAPSLPPHLRGRGYRGGWLNAEYAMLPRATRERTPRERGSVRGRTQEIQRLLGRALRATVDLSAFPGSTLVVDCDVVQADGGTRCAAIVAAYAALHQLADRQVFAGKLDEWPLRHELAAVSVGLVGGEVRLDLDHDEDAAASVDLAVVGTASGAIVEVHGGGEGAPIEAEAYVRLVAVGLAGVADVLAAARPGWSA
ncbi:MAG: ribonuclease PH, partial [Trueperaceae bacterium]|nr:ribonuclease PH [Trueperaceae bacterium]